MKDTKEIKALLHLLDDPDQEVFETISNKIMHYGKDIIPNLEDFWEHSSDSFTQERIENIIHKVNFNEVYSNFEQWFAKDKPLLIDGAISLCRYRFPDYHEEEVRKLIKSIYQSCWLELNNYLTPLEQVTIVNSIFYSMYKFKGYKDDQKPSHFYLNEVAESRVGNNYSLGILYSILCEMLDIPVYMVALPQQCLLAYFDTIHDFFNIEAKPSYKIQFYLDPLNGTIFTQTDVNAYLKKYKFENITKYSLPLSNQKIISNCMQSLSELYEALGQFENSDELKVLSQLYDRQA